MTSGLDAMYSLPTTSITGSLGGDVLPMSWSTSATIPSTNGSAFPVLQTAPSVPSTAVPPVYRENSQL
jgi:hypothetical protein